MSCRKAAPGDDTISPAQCRAARALLAMTQAELARAAVVPVASVIDFQTGVKGLRPADLDALQHALEQAGVEFIDGNQPTTEKRRVFWM